MAKISRFAITKISATLNADYKENDDVKDAFFLDGRMARKREQYGADITSAVEDRGFFYAVFANSHAEAEEKASAAGSLLNQMTEAVKQSNDKIDNEINDLADCAVEVGGRATIAREGVRQSYFAGIILKEAEIAAVTRGGGCAFLYRNSALYPLTTCDYELVNADYHGNAIDHMMDFSAGVAGTIRYSNIAQVQPDDILVLCNKEVLEAVGQRELIKILYEHQNCGEAAAEIIDLAREKDERHSLQIILANVNDVILPDRTSRLNLGLFQNQNESVSQETTRYEPITGELNEISAEKTSSVPEVGQQKPEDSAAPVYPQYGTQDTRTYSDQAVDENNDAADAPFKPDYSAAQDQPAASEPKQQADGSEQQAAQDYAALDEKPVFAAEDLSESEQAEDPDQVPIFEPVVPVSGRQKTDDFAAGRQYIDDDYQDYEQNHAAYDQNAWQDDRETENVPAADPNYDDDDYYQDDEDEFYIDDEKKPGNIRRTVLYVVLILICLACVYALVRMISTGDKTGKTDKGKESESVASEEPAVIQTTDEAEVRTPIQTKATTTEPSKMDETNKTEPSDQGSTGTGTLSGTAYVTTEGLRMRAEPNTESEVIAEFAEGEMVEILEAAGDNWYLVRSTDGNDFEGYMLGDYLKD